MKTINMAIAALSLCACAGGAPEEPPAPAQKQHQALAAPTPAGVALKLTAEDSGQNVTVRKGTTFAVELVGTPTAGYLWMVDDMPAFLEKGDDYGGPTSSAQSEPGFAGGNHWEGFTFKVTGTGEGVLRLGQRRDWEGAEVPPVGEFSVHLFAEE